MAKKKISGTKKPKGKKPPPKVLAMVVCDNVIIDLATKNRTLVNVFGDILASNFPAIHPKLTIFLELTNGHGVCPIEIRFVEVATEVQLFSLQGNIEFPDPLAVVSIAFGVNNIVFKNVGEYRFQLYGSGELLMERRIVVRQTGEKQE